MLVLNDNPHNRSSAAKTPDIRSRNVNRVSWTTILASRSDLQFSRRRHNTGWSLTGLPPVDKRIAAPHTHKKSRTARFWKVSSAKVVNPLPPSCLWVSREWHEQSGVSQKPVLEHARQDDHQTCTCSFNSVPLDERATLIIPRVEEPKVQSSASTVEAPGLISLSVPDVRDAASYEVTKAAEDLGWRGGTKPPRLQCATCERHHVTPRSLFRCRISALSLPHHVLSSGRLSGCGHLSKHNMRTTILAQASRLPPTEALRGPSHSQRLEACEIPEHTLRQGGKTGILQIPLEWRRSDKRRQI